MSKKYDIETRKKIVDLVLTQHMSYREIEKSYHIPRNTAFSWVKNFKQRGNVNPMHKAGGIDYKEQYEILKKFQAFLKSQQEKK